MSCDNCIRLTSGTRISLPRHLRLAIKNIANAAQAGTLKYEGAGKFGDPFSKIAKGGHWSDFVSNYFSCTSCGQLFHLHAETYHGAGGAFEKITVIEEELTNEPGDI